MSTGTPSRAPRSGTRRYRASRYWPGACDSWGRPDSGGARSGRLSFRLRPGGLRRLGLRVAAGAGGSLASAWLRFPVAGRSRALPVPSAPGAQRLPLHGRARNERPSCGYPVVSASGRGDPGNRRVAVPNPVVARAPLTDQDLGRRKECDPGSRRHSRAGPAARDRTSGPLAWALIPSATRGEVTRRAVRARRGRRPVRSLSCAYPRCGVSKRCVDDVRRD